MRLAFLATVSLASTAAFAAAKPAAKPVALPAGSGRTQVQAACAGCHAMTVVTGQRYTAAKWGQVVDQMADRGAKVGDADYNVIVAYLAKNFGPKR